MFLVYVRENKHRKTEAHCSISKLCRKLTTALTAVQSSACVSHVK